MATPRSSVESTATEFGQMVGGNNETAMLFGSFWATAMIFGEAKRIGRKVGERAA